jgi:hypothetical protein
MGLPTAQPPCDPLRFPSLLFLSSKKDPQVPENSTQSAPPSASVQAPLPRRALRPKEDSYGWRRWVEASGAADACAAPGDVDQDDGGPDQRVAAAGSGRKTMPRRTARNWQLGDRGGSGWTLVGDQPVVQHVGRAGSRPTKDADGPRTAGVSSTGCSPATVVASYAPRSRASHRRWTRRPASATDTL